ncbi:MAG: DUF6152 family protein [Pseudomonadales bacterium]|nr:DUF6152 family protein [Pseudomonadales bacterium]
MNTATLKTRLLVLLTTLSLAAPVLAHHSFAMYDQDITKTLTGRLTRFIVGANHSQFVFDVVDDKGMTLLDDKGAPVIWGVETGPAGQIARQGITVESFPIGTYFTVTLNPLRDGRPFGTLRGGIILCGTELPEAGCKRETGTVFLERN